MSRVTPASVRRISAYIHPAREAARRVSHEHRLFRLALEQRPVHRTRDFEDQLPEAPEVSQGPVKGCDGGNVHFGAGDLLQHAREVAVTTRPPGSPTDDHYGCARHAREYIRLQARLDWRPSITNCTASAASRTPSTRESTLAPVSPRSLMTRGASSREPRVRSRTTSSTTMNNATWPALLPPVKRRTVVIPPGPARSGMARGKTEMSCWYCSSSCSRTVVARIPEGLAKTMSSESKKSSRPPAIRKAGSPMPRASSSTSPASANTYRIRAPSSVPLMADSRFCFSEKPWVSAPKMGASPSGSMTTSSVTNALNTYSIGRDFTSR